MFKKENLYPIVNFLKKYGDISFGELRKKVRNGMLKVKLGGNIYCFKYCNNLWYLIEIK